MVRTRNQALGLLGARLRRLMMPSLSCPLVRVRSMRLKARDTPSAAEWRGLCVVAPFSAVGLVAVSPNPLATAHRSSGSRMR